MSDRYCIQFGEQVDISAENLLSFVWHGVSYLDTPPHLIYLYHISNNK